MEPGVFPRSRLCQADSTPRREEEPQPTACDGRCGLPRCPSTRNKEFKCDTYGDIGPGRTNTLMQQWNAEHKRMVDEKRRELGRPAIKYSETTFVEKPKLNVHSSQPPTPTSDAAVEEEASLESVLAEMATRWHTDGITDE